MCGRYTSTSTTASLASMFSVDEVDVDEGPPRFNVAPTQGVRAVAERGKAERDRPCRQLGTYRWGLVPSWAKDPSIGARLINARAEGIATKNVYRTALARRRCIIPADAFYEWQLRPGAAKARKLPYLICHRDRSPLAFAGLWETWHDDKDPAGVLASCVIITTEANTVVAPIHTRMPVVLPAASWDSWLDRGNDDVHQLQALLVPARAEDFEVYPVSTAVGNVANDNPELVDPRPPQPPVSAEAGQRSLFPVEDR